MPNTDLESKLGQSQVRQRRNIEPPPPMCSTSAGAMEDATRFYPISCENCRNKKSKCDRELPICSQCVSSGINCRYPPINKRGIPSGYLSYIEQRLLDTELVVFELLSAIYKSHIPILPQRLSETDRQALTDISQKQPKSAKIEEWKSLPLTTDEHRHDWWLKRCDAIALPVQTDPSNHSQDVMTPQDTWLEASPLSVQYEDIQPHTGTQPPVPRMPQSSALITPWQQPMDDVISGSAGTFDNKVHTAICPSLENVSQSGAGITLAASTESNTSNNSQPLSAERWRKYF